MIAVPSPSLLLLRSVLLSLAGLALGWATTSWLPTATVGVPDRLAVLAFPSTNGDAGVGISLVNVDGELAGLSLVNVRPQSPWARAGLQDGDVVVAVDGASVSNLAVVLDLMTSGFEHRLVYTRAGQQHSAQLAFTPISTLQAPGLEPSICNP